MQKSLFLKLGAMLLLIGVLLGVLSSISQVVDERAAYNTQVIDRIKTEYVADQTLVGPFLVVPVVQTYECHAEAPATQGSKKVVSVKKICSDTVERTVAPRKSHWTHDLKVSDEDFKSGSYSAITYTDSFFANGHFDLPHSLLEPQQGEKVLWDQARVYLGLSDLRGVQGQPLLTLSNPDLTQGVDQNLSQNATNNPAQTTDQKFEMKLPGLEEQGDTVESTLSAKVGKTVQTDSLNFNLSGALVGLGELQVIPVGEDMSMKLTADWPHPSFYGQLPKKELGETGFSAEWQNTYASLKNTRLLSGSLNDLGRMQDQGSIYGLALINPVNIYSMTDRTLKYGLLFIVLTFMVFFLFEVLKELKIHPIQYGLVGLALATFYLLLLSFSEQVGFALAYVCASTACTLLICWYVSHLLGSISRALGLGFMLALMYGVLYVIISSEDLALALGSSLVFAVVFAVMWVTRKVDWYAMGREAKQAQQSQKNLQNQRNVTVESAPSKPADTQFDFIDKGGK